MDVRFGGLLPHVPGNRAIVSCGALLDLNAVLRCASFSGSDVVLQGQHRSLLTPGGADAKITNPTESRSIQTISST